MDVVTAAAVGDDVLSTAAPDRGTKAKGEDSAR